jgi:Holliday junction resolvase RusA-like endonuclease
MIITLIGERPISWNKVNGRAHWSVRRGETDRVHELVRDALAKLNPRRLTGPVSIRITVYFKDRPLDSDNVCDKPYIDALKGVIIPDDHFGIVWEATTCSRIDKKNPRLEIKVEEIAA